MKGNQFGRKKNPTLYQVVPECKTECEEDLLTLDSVDAVDGLENYTEYGKVYMLGEKSSGSKTAGSLQNYTKLRQYHLQNKTLFSDETFVPETIALPKLSGEVIWKRPFEITNNPGFIVDGATRFDIDQGELGDCWFLAAIANVTLNQKLFSIVVPSDQTFTENYAGIFHFRFWQYGRWVDVVIDDRLPTINNKLVLLRSTDPQEFWPSLLEKAYAKIYGSYKNIEGGQISEALEDLCGGLSEFYYANHPAVYEIMETSFKRASFMGCSIASVEVEGRRADGLITSHAYSVTDIKRITTVDNTEKKLIRIRNPWGDNTEWNGDWSDNSETWNSIPKEIKDSVLHRKPDGEFWMASEDFQKCFTFVDICHQNPSAFFYSKGDNKNWSVNTFEGSWVPNVTAGGGLEYLDTFANNPQYHLTVRGKRSKTESYALVIGLMQKDRRTTGQNELPLELNIFEIETREKELLDKSFFELSNPILHKSEVGVRQLTVRVMLPVGRFCIVPSVGEPNVHASYLLRIYSEVNANLVEIDEEVGYSKDAVMNQSGQESQNRDNKTEVGWYKVQQTLNRQYGTRRLLCFMKPKVSFSKDTSKTIVALWDTDFSGKLDDGEFGKLMADVAVLKERFKKFDVKNTGKLNGFQLRKLLTACGYKVNRQILVIIMLRYGNNGSLKFENFVMNSIDEKISKLVIISTLTGRIGWKLPFIPSLIFSLFLTLW